MVSSIAVAHHLAFLRSSRPGRREEFPHVASIFSQQLRVAAVYTLAAVAAERRFPMKNVAEAIGVRAHFSWHTFAVPHPAHSIRTSEHCHVFLQSPCFDDYETFEHVTADVPHFIDEVYNTPLRAEPCTVRANCAKAEAAMFYVNAYDIFHSIKAILKGR